MTRHIKDTGQQMPESHTPALPHSTAHRTATGKKAKFLVGHVGLTVVEAEMLPTVNALSHSVVDAARAAAMPVCARVSVGANVRKMSQPSNKKREP